MNTREFPVLDDGDDLAGRLAVGLGDNAARVLAYLLQRRETERFEDLATRLVIRIGTSLNKETVTAALGDLEDRGFVTATTLPTDTHGRPLMGWYAPKPIATTIQRVDDQHAAALLKRATTVATALGRESSEPSNANPTDGPAFESFCLGLSWSPNPLHAPFFVAASVGEYERMAIDIGIEHFWGSGRALERLVDGTVDVALAGAATTLRAREAGDPVLPVAVVFQRAMATLYTTRETFGETFESVAQLRGRRVGLSPTSETGLLARVFLSQAGVLEDVTIVDVTGEERAALRSGRAAVVAGSFADPKRFETDRTVDSVLIADRFPIYGPAIVTTEATLRNHQPTLRRFLTGTIAGWAAALADPKTAVAAVPAATGNQHTHSYGSMPDDYHVFEHAVAAFGGGNAIEDHGWGWQEVAGWERLETALDRTGLLGEAVP